MPELLAPAGNFEKLRAALLYGADAVYLSGKSFGMRAAADNFTDDELAEALALVHAQGKRAYIAVNIMPRTAQYAALRAYFELLRPLAPDALIVADVGVLTLARQVLPEVAIHISTQANAVSAEACRAWHAMGASRVVLSREITLEEIRAIRQNTPPALELEAFIHGSMCVSYSGRCLLSNYLIGRDANRGACAQPCRWHYTLNERHFELVEEKRPDTPLPVEEIGGETFFMSSRDTSMIAHIPELIDAGIDSFKIEGRVKSAMYAATVTNAYRMAIDAAMAGDRTYNPAWGRELVSVAHRPYHTGYYYDDCHENANITEEMGYIKEKAALAVVLSYDGESGTALCQQKNKFSVGDAVELLTPGKTGAPARITALYNEMGEEISSAPHPQMRVRVPLPYPARAGDILRAANEKEE